jgi:hypothetical protein
MGGVNCTNCKQKNEEKEITFFFETNQNLIEEQEFQSSRANNQNVDVIYYTFKENPDLMGKLEKLQSLVRGYSRRKIIRNSIKIENGNLEAPMMMNTTQYSNEEMKINIEANNKITQMSKQVAKEKIIGEFLKERKSESSQHNQRRKFQYHNKFH